MMTRWKFEMALRCLLELDMQELVDAGAIADRDYTAWDAFKADPVAWLLAHPVEAEGVWRAIWMHARGDVPLHSSPPDNVIDLDIARGGKR